jgi:hypothetical protein
MTTACQRPYANDPLGPTRTCWCPIRETLICTGAGTFGCIIPLLALSFHWKQDLARQRLAKATMHMMEDQRRAMFEHKTTTLASGGGIRPCVSCGHGMTHLFFYYLLFAYIYHS